jgi:hypothetical protein
MKFIVWKATQFRFQLLCRSKSNRANAVFHLPTQCLIEKKEISDLNTGLHPYIVRARETCLYL